MSTSKFSVTALLLIVIIFTAIGFLATVYLTDLTGFSLVNDVYPVEGTDLFVRYSPKLPNGLCDGEYSDSELLFEGNFGYDWGAAAQGDTLYTNEYTTTTLGLMLCDLVRVDLKTLEKETLLKNTVLRGKCASGELVCLSECMLPSNYPKSNSLCRLYSLSAADLRPEEDQALVLFIDPATSDVVYSIRSAEALSEKFDELYIERTLEEVKG